MLCLADHKDLQFSVILLRLGPETPHIATYMYIKLYQYSANFNTQDIRIRIQVSINSPSPPPAYPYLLLPPKTFPIELPTFCAPD